VDALDVLKVCLRRWYVVVPIVLLSLGAGLGLAHQQKPTYTAFASYALVYHDQETNAPGREPLAPNPLAGEGAELLGEAMVADFMSEASQASLGGVGNSGTAPREPKDGTSYSVSLPDGSQSYVVQSWGKDPESLRRVVDSVLTAAPLRAQQIQDRAGAPIKSQYTTFVTGSTQLAKLPPTSRLKLLIALLGIGILVGSALSLIVDRLVRSRKGRAAADASQLGSWWDTDASPATEKSDSAVILTVSPPDDGSPQLHANESEPVRVGDGKLQSRDATGLDATAAEDVVTHVPAVQAEERPPYGAEEFLAVDAAEVFAVDAESVPTTDAVEVPTVGADERSSSGAEEGRAIDAVDVDTSGAEGVPSPSAPAALEHAPEDAPAVSADEVSMHESPVFSADWDLGELQLDWDDLPADVGRDDVLAAAAEEPSQVGHAQVEQRHELETEPVTEDPGEADSEQMNAESEVDDDFWPLLEHKQEFEAEDFDADDADNHTRTWQRTH
jgi:hypothetical protein